MSAREFAAAATAHDVRSDPASVEAAALAADPAFAETVARIGRVHAERIRTLKRTLMAEVRAADPVAARTMAPSARRGLGLLAAYLAAAGAFAFYFSRAQFDLEIITPVAMGFAAVSALLYLLAALPISRTSPPASNIAFAGWLLAALTGAAVGFGGYLVLRFVPEAAPWLLLGVAAVIVHISVAIACAVARRDISVEERAATETRIASFPDRLRAAAEEERESADAALREAWAELSDERRNSIESDLAAASGILAERGITVPELAVPAGTVGLRRKLALAAVTIGIPDL